MKRREFIVLAGGATAWPLAARAQQTGKVYRVSLIFTTAPVSEMVGPDPVHPLIKTFLQSLRAHGYVEGQNLIWEPRSAEGRFERFGDIVAELVRLRVDAIVTIGNQMATEAKRVTTAVPIVMTTSVDPDRAGIVASIARPGGNVTGLT
jgi:putative ABC transport system substrate-binding protein